MLVNGNGLGILKKVESETMYDAVQREVKQVRESAGILDGSTLGKIEIKGRDALEFVNLMYTNSFTKMKPMSGRYGLMLGEDGMVKDDGIICKINDQAFYCNNYYWRCRQCSFAYGRVCAN